MALVHNLYFVIILPNVFGYFLPHPFQYVPLLQYLNFFQYHDVSPVLIQDLNERKLVDNAFSLIPEHINKGIMPIIGKHGRVLEDKNVEAKSLRKNIHKNLFKDFGTSLDVTFNMKKEDPLVAKCREKYGGALVNNECYKFYKEELTWDDARLFCKEKGGIKADLWTPYPMDAFLQYKMSYLMPEYGKAFSDIMWLGAKFDAAGEKINEVNGKDITNTFLTNISSFNVERRSDCLALAFLYGGFLTGGGQCSRFNLNFICEFDLSEPSSSSKVSILNKFNFIKEKLKLGKK